MPILHVAIPHHDEARTLPELLVRLADAALPEGWTRRVVVCDDASPPESRRTAEDAIERLRQQGIPAVLVAHDRQRGKGAAVRTALTAILSDASDIDAVVLQDADLEYDPRDHAPMVAALARGSGAVYGSRWSTGARSLGAVQRLGNRLLTLASNRMTGQRLTDMECGLKLIRVAVLRTIVDALDEEGFGIEPQITAALSRVGVRIAEVPVAYAPRTVAEGKKIRWRDGIEALRVIRRERRRPASPRGAVAT